MLDAQELGVVLRQATRSLFRLELQPLYDVPTTGSDFERYLAGEPGPDMERKGRWLDFLREQRAQGIYRHRVRVLRTPLSDYDRYACEWGYAFNVEAGDDTRILDLTRQSVRTWVDHDFWLVDHRLPVRMNYDANGKFLGAEVVETGIDLYQATRNAVWDKAVSFKRWWREHPQYLRAVRAVS